MVKYTAHDLTANLAKILCRVLDDRMPGDDDVRGLTQGEHEFLYKLARSAKVDDRLALPTSKIDAEEKEMHRFEVLKGQIRLVMTARRW